MERKIIDQLFEKALLGYENAYAPYSKFRVGASVLLKDGTIVYGCNVENASYGLCNCGERTALFKAISEGYKKEDIVGLLVVANTKNPVSPCGACRQVMTELMGLDCEVILCNLHKEIKVYKVGDLLPYSFEGDVINESF